MATTERSTAILDVRPMLRGSEKAVVEAVLGRRPGGEQVEANPVSQTATVTYNPAETSVAELRRWVQECGLHCAGQSVPNHICDPLMEPDPSGGHGHHAGTVDTKAPAADADHHRSYAAAPSAQPDHRHQNTAVPAAGGHAGHAPPAETPLRSPHEMMGHGGHGAMSMEAMVADMRNRFLVAALFSIPILLWSPIGREVLGFELAAPFGLRVLGGRLEGHRDRLPGPGDQAAAAVHQRRPVRLALPHRRARGQRNDAALPDRATSARPTDIA